MVAKIIQETKSDTWCWHSWEGLPYLTCSLLENWNHGFFTSAFAPRTPEEIVAALDSEAKVYRIRQVHGNIVLTPSEIDSEQVLLEPGDLPAGDAILTTEARQAVWVCSADCTPVLIADAKTGQVAAVHAGWRGTATRIVPNAIARLLDSGSRLEDLRIAMGPAIAGEVYQVSETVAAEVGASILSGTAQSILEELQQLPNPPILDDSKPGRVRLDVRRVNALQMEQLGINAEQIAIAPYCTYQQPEHFFSYRREQLKKVQWSGIVSKTPS